MKSHDLFLEASIVGCIIFYVIDKTVKLWKISERCTRAEGFNLSDDRGMGFSPDNLTELKVPVLKPSELTVEASPRKIFANAHTYHINSISINSDDETYLSADDLRINLWHLGITNQSFSILLRDISIFFFNSMQLIWAHSDRLIGNRKKLVCILYALLEDLVYSFKKFVCLNSTLSDIVDIKPANMEELTEVITAAEFHPVECNIFAYSSSKGTVRLCDMRKAALCDRHSKCK